MPGLILVGSDTEGLFPEKAYFCGLCMVGLFPGKLRNFGPNPVGQVTEGLF